MTLKEMITARNRFRRECRLTWEWGRRKKAWRVPGTREHGIDAMWEADIQRARAREGSASHA